LGRSFLKHDSRQREVSAFDIRDLDVLLCRTTILPGKSDECSR
jgi:hypothetical protein